MNNPSLIQPVVLCGGSGTRLWPRSRSDRPKPFLPLLGETTLFEATLARCSDPMRFAPPIIVAGAAHVDFIAEQSQGIDGIRIVVEPEGRNTAPAIALAAGIVDPQAVMLVCPSDHHIADDGAFGDAATNAASLAREGWLTSIAIRATRPETGYGYLRRGEVMPGGHRVAEFVEKPEAARAEAFLADGGYDWNGGIFAFEAGRFLKQLALHRPEMAAHCDQAVSGGCWKGSAFHPEQDAFAAISGESVDYAVMEHTDRAAMVSADMGWSDIGNWASLHDASARDDAGNTAPKSADLVDCSNVMVSSDGPRVSVIGAQDLIIVADGDEILVTSRGDAQRVGQLKGATGQ